MDLQRNMCGHDVQTDTMQFLAYNPAAWPVVAMKDLSRHCSTAHHLWMMCNCLQTYCLVKRFVYVEHCCGDNSLILVLSVDVQVHITFDGHQYCMPLTSK